MSTNQPISYADAGVDRDKGDEFVKRISRMVRSTYTKAVKGGVGGFASLYEIGKGRYLAAGTDGVGTKLKLAQSLGIHDTIGIDLVAMCVNDVLCTGAKPLFFLDYFACGKLDLPVSEAVLKGIVDGCTQAGTALVGGETAEMPGMYQNGEYDLAGFCVGEVDRKNLLDGKKVKPGDALVALPSSGAHSNGYSLIRKLLREEETELLRLALAPTRIYVKPVLAALANKSCGVHGLAHITGSGFFNIPRMNEKLGYRVTALPEPLKIFEVLRERSALPPAELYSTFNMGIGMVIATDKPETLIRFLKGKKQPAFLMGEVTKRKGKIEVETRRESFTLDYFA